MITVDNGESSRYPLHKSGAYDTKQFKHSQEKTMV